MAEEIISGTVLIFLCSSQASQNKMFSSLYSDFRNSRKAICPAGNVRDTGVSLSRAAPRVDQNQSLTFATQDLIHRLGPSLNILQRVLGEATQATLEKSMEIYH